jgi:glycine/D-amino acid oxidase-like deaminating enzyme
MGAWTALKAQRAGFETTLLDAYGAGHLRATSGDESRTIRSVHGTDDLYARWARESLVEWKALAEESGEPLFVPTGVIWFAGTPDGFEHQSEVTLGRLGIPTEHLSLHEIEARLPGVLADGLAFGLLEPEAGVIRARRGVQAAVLAFQRAGGSYDLAAVRPGHADGRRLLDVVDQAGERRTADSFVFACGPWLPRLFSDVLGSVITVTKQDVLFFGPAGGDKRFTSDRMPAWVEYDAAFYGIPSIDDRGVKSAPDRYGPLFDPSAGERVVDPESIRLARAYLRRRIPALADVPVVETRVCQYETTVDTHFVIDRHPAFDNVWLVGGGSGHGFKHGPRIGQFVTARLRGEPLAAGEERFSIATLRRPQQGMRMGAHSNVDAGAY